VGLPVGLGEGVGLGKKLGVGVGDAVFDGLGVGDNKVTLANKSPFPSLISSTPKFEANTCTGEDLFTVLF
jgi:hypothetical protein